MRKELERIQDVRDVFIGEFVRLGLKNGYKKPLTTVLLKNIRDKNGKLISDHLWFNYTLGFKNLCLQEGDMIEFHARVKSYIKGYFGYRMDVYKPIEEDYKLSYPTKLRKINR